MYEVGIEHVMPFRIVGTVRGYAKYNVDQVSNLQVTVGDGYSTYRNANYEEVRGLEIKIARTSGRFINGWVTLDEFTTRTGEVGILQFNTANIAQASYYTAFARSNEPLTNLKGFLRIGTPRDWGTLAGGWGLSILQTYREGSEVIYRPDPTIPIRELPPENFMKTIDYWFTNLKIDKTFSMGRTMSFSAYADVTNLFNTKALSGAGGDYIAYVFQRRQNGETGLRVNDPSTFDALTHPYKDAGGNWKAPLNPRTEWLSFRNKRVVRLGLRFDM